MMETKQRESGFSIQCDCGRWLYLTTLKSKINEVVHCKTCGKGYNVSATILWAER